MPDEPTAARGRWSWYDPMNPTHYAMFALGMWAGANLVGLAWLAVWLWT